MSVDSDFVRSDRPYDAIVVGAGASGLYSLYHLRKLGYNAMIIEAGSGVAGTWHWNTYPGLRVDIESVEYSYAFDDDLQQEWNWTERYAAQPELKRYFNHVADRFELRPYILLENRVERATWNEGDHQWVIETDKGNCFKAPIVIMATGLLSAPNHPEFDGMANFQGEIIHTARWPEEAPDFSTKRVAVIGTGCSGIQVISELAKTAKHLTVFQRTPNFAVPLRNEPMPEDYAAEVKANYPAWRKREKYESFGGWASVNFKMVDQVFANATDQTPQEREALYEDRWKSGGLAFYNVYPDIFSDKTANDTLAEFLRRKLRERINDPELEEKLIPTDYPVLMRRLCGETDYYEAFKRDNVKLVDCRADPIECFTTAGIKTKGSQFDFDVVIFATGYDAMSGAMMRMDIVGRDEKSLKEHWSSDIRTTFGLMAAGFPNMFYISGPGTPAPLYQPMLFCEDQMAWITDLIEHSRDLGTQIIDSTEDFEQKWVDECDQVLQSTLFLETESWYVSGNIEGKPAKGLIYFGGIHPYREFIRDCAEAGYAGLKFE